MVAKIQKSSDLGEIWFPSRSWSCELIIVIVFGIGSHGVGWCLLLLCNGNYSYYYYSSSFFLSFFRQKFVRHITRRLLNGNQWNFTGMLSTMSRCADHFHNFQNGRRCHGTGQNAKKLKNTKMIISGYSPNSNWWNLLGTTTLLAIKRKKRICHQGIIKLVL